ncbi:MAG TPA: O-antigen polysaccharide polymerase Wzy [Actinomycetota bacterium]|nr:O-antigen polysaccharide polymerase Wzy [Actinomycetota bacterium]
MIQEHRALWVDAAGEPVGRLASREYARVVLIVVVAPATAWLAWLVVRHEPLPIQDFGTAATVTAVSALVAAGLALALHRLHPLSFPSLFLGVTFLFTCSPLLLYHLEGYDAFRIWEFVDLTSVSLAMPVVLLGFSSFLLGTLLLPTEAAAPRPAGPAPPAAVTPRERALRRLGFALYAACAAVVLGSTLAGQGLAHALEGGYAAYHGAKRAGDVSRFVGVSVTHLLPWSLLILAATSRTRRARRQVVLLAVPFVAAMLAVGDRGGPVATVAVVASALYLVGSRLGWGRALAVGLAIAFLIPTILNLRQVPISAWSRTAIADAAANRIEGTNTFRDDPVTGFLVSMSSPYQTLMATVQVVPAREGYHLGGDYLSSLIVALPFRSVLFRLLGMDVDRLPPSQWILLTLHPGRTAGPGYLQLAEAYLQFGAAGVVGLYALLGWALTRLWRRLERMAWDPRLLAFSLIVMMETLLWIRNSSTLIVRAVAWGWILVYVAPALLGARRGRQPAPAIGPAPGP